MTLVIDATVGGATANSYNLESELDTFAAEQFPEPVDWTSLSPGDDTRLRAMIAATRRLDLERYVHTRVDAIQSLEWPRAWVPKVELYSWNGVFTGETQGYWLNTEIPTPVKTAHALLTFYLVQQNAKGIDPFASLEEAGIQSMQLGYQIDVAFEKGATSVTAGARFMATRIRPVLTQFQLVYSPQVRVVRG